MRLARVILEGLLVAFLAGLAVYLLRDHVFTGLLVAIVICLAGIVLVSFLERYGWSRIRAAISGLLAHLPFTVQIQRRPRPSLPPGERGWLDFRRDGERAVKEMSAVMTEMTRQTNRHNKRLNRHTRSLNKASERHFSVERVYRLGQAAARDTNRHVDKMEELEVRLRYEGASMIQNFTDWLRTQPDDSQVAGFLAEVRDLGAATTTSRRSTEQYREVVQEQRRQSFSQPVNQANDRLIALLSKILEDTEATERFCRNPRGGGASRRGQGRRK